jgi:hypothetical protein
VYGTIGEDRVADGESTGDALAAAFRWSAAVLTLVSAAGVALAMLAGRARRAERTPSERAEATAASSHTIVPPVRPSAVAHAALETP